jgi:hypothetical protein
MKEYHVLFHSQSGIFYAIYLWFDNFGAVEKWLESIKSIYWEIGI